ncbi:MAG: hypothetical protein AABN95_06875 [Acidobacteriota bacterium]
MNCTEAQQNLEPALDGVLDKTGRQLLHEHVSTCALCKEKLAQLEGVRALLREAGPTQPSQSLDARVMGSFRKHHAASSGGAAAPSRLRDLFLGSLRVPVPIMAILLLAVTAMVFVAYRTGKQNAQYIVGGPVAVVGIPEAPPETPSVSYTPLVVDKTVPVQAPSRIVQVASRHRRNKSSAGIKNEVTEQPLKSSTVITSNSTSYSTVAVLKGFEPLPTATARIIKGEQR